MFTSTVHKAVQFAFFGVYVAELDLDVPDDTDVIYDKISASGDDVGGKSFGSGFDRVWDIHVSQENYVFLSGDASGIGEGQKVWIYDKNDNFLSSVDPVDIPKCARVKNNNLFICSSYPKLESWDISDINNPVNLWSLNSPSSLSEEGVDLAIDEVGNYLYYLATDGCRKYDFSGNEITSENWPVILSGIGDQSRVLSFQGKVFVSRNQSVWVYTSTGVQESVIDVNQDVYDIAIDKLGFLYVATENAIRKYKIDDHSEIYTKSNRVTAHGSIEYNGSMYVLGGDNESLGYMDRGSEFWTYNFSTRDWSRLTDLPVGRRNHIAEIYNGKIYVYGGIGSGGSGELNDLWEYDISSGIWTELTNGSGKRMNHISTIYNGKIYVLGGHYYDGTSTQYLNDFWQYDIPSDTWTELTNYPKSSIAVRDADVYNGKIYVVDYYSTTEYEIQEYDIPSDTWNQFDIISNTTSSGGLTVNIYGDKMYIYSDTFVIYDFIDGSTTEQSPDPNRRRYHTTVIYNEKIYLYGGSIGIIDGMSDLWEYDISLNSWTKIPLKGWPFENHGDVSDYIENYIVRSLTVNMNGYVYSGGSEGDWGGGSPTVRKISDLGEEIWSTLVNPEIVYKLSSIGEVT